MLRLIRIAALKKLLPVKVNLRRAENSKRARVKRARVRGAKVKKAKAKKALRKLVSEKVVSSRKVEKVASRKKNLEVNSKRIKVEREVEREVERKVVSSREVEGEMMDLVTSSTMTRVVEQKNS
jgi:hypothetical protein